MGVQVEEGGVAVGKGGGAVGLRGLAIVANGSIPWEGEREEGNVSGEDTQKKIERCAPP